MVQCGSSLAQKTAAHFPNTSVLYKELAVAKPEGKASAIPIPPLSPQRRPANLVNTRKGEVNRQDRD